MSKLGFKPSTARARILLPRTPAPQGVNAGLQRLRDFAHREFVFGAVHVSVLGRMHFADQVR